ncbi:MAG TPA: Ig-like domain-containing protein [Longimicrobium sp.]|nr:Ig-like domain-containing protein [Longimicrobium sp.]
MRWSSRVALSLLVAVAAACADGGSPLGPGSTARTPNGASGTIWDGAHAGAAYDTKFYFLPPMVKNPKDDKKSADGRLQPTVEVCELASGGACGRVVERFENVPWLGNHYHVNFHAGRYTLDPAKRLRVTVYVGSLTMGWADVIVGRSARDFKGVDGEQYVTITTSQTLAIKFRIGEGIAAAIRVTPPEQTVRTGDGASYAAAVTGLHGEPLNVPVTWTSSDPSIASVDASGVVTTYRPGTVTITASAERVSGSATLVVKPLVARVEVDPAIVDIGGTVTLVARAYDGDGNRVEPTEPFVWTVLDTDGNLVTITSETGVVQGLAPGTTLATATVSGVSGSGPVTVSTDIDLPSICTETGFDLYGAATVLPDDGCALRITPGSVWTTGSAWATAKQPLANGFEVRFGMRLSQPGPDDFLVQGNTRPGADGLVFVIQNHGADAGGNAGVGIGYLGLRSSLAVEFDTWLNPGERDPSSNHVSVHTNGTGPNHTSEEFSIGAADIPGDLYDGQVHEVVVRYVPGTLTIQLDGATILTVNVTLTNIGGGSILDADGKAWVGFTAATGMAYGIHDVVSWSVHTND